MNREIFVVTGGTFAGKTTTVECIAAKNYRVLGESAMEVIGELAKTMGLDESIEWRRKEPSKFQLMIAQRQQFKESVASELQGAVFADRGALDAIAYSRLYGIPVLDELTAIASQTTYSAAFILDVLPDFDNRHGSGRICSVEEAVEVGRIISNVYKEYGVVVHQVPVMSVDDRTQFVLQTAFQQMSSP